MSRPAWNLEGPVDHQTTGTVRIVGAKCRGLKRQLARALLGSASAGARRARAAAERHLAVVACVHVGRALGVSLPLGPQTSSTSSLISLWSRPSPMPTDSVSSASLAAPTSSPSAS